MQVIHMDSSDPPGDIHYSMRVVTRMTGLNADTIRAWERRYGAVTPKRTGGNTRKYNASDVRRLILLREATRQGYRIGDVAKLDEAELASLSKVKEVVSDSPATGDDGEAFSQIRDDYLEAIADFDTRSAERLLGRSAAVLDPRDFVLRVVLPIMRETGALWESGAFSVAHEHVVSMQVRSLLGAILRISSPLAGAPRIITATPEGHLHEFGALTAALLAALRGFDVLHLGVEVPERDLLGAAKLGDVGLVVVSVILRTEEGQTKELARSLEKLTSEVETWVGLAEDHLLVSYLEKARVLHSFDDLDLELTRLLT